MKTLLRLLCCAGMLLTAVCPVPAADPPRSLELLHLPMQFIENAGQWDADVRYGMIGQSSKAAFTRQGVVLWRPLHRPTELAVERPAAMSAPAAFEQPLERLDLRFVRPSPALRVHGLGARLEATQIYRGGDSAGWHEKLPSHDGLRYADVWPHIDVEYAQRDGKVLQRIVLHPGADARNIAFTGSAAVLHDIAAGMGDAAELSPGAGMLGDTLRLRPYRNFLERRMLIESEFNSLYGGSGRGLKCRLGLDLDSRGNIHITLLTTSTDLPVHAAAQAQLAGDYDIYHACLAPDARSLRFATYLGGSSDELPGYHAGSTWHSYKLMRVGMEDAVHILCNTRSDDFPITANALQAQRPSELSAEAYSVVVLSRLDSAGLLSAASWLGDPGSLMGMDLTVDASGNVIMFLPTDGEQWFVTPGTLQDRIIFRCICLVYLHERNGLAARPCSKSMPNIGRSLPGRIYSMVKGGSGRCYWVVTNYLSWKQTRKAI
jgi:hypothetical protein